MTKSDTGPQAAGSPSEPASRPDLSTGPPSNLGATARPSADAALLSHPNPPPDSHLGFVPDWPTPPGVRSFQTTRTGGVSLAGYLSLNLARHTGDDGKAVAENRARLRAALALPREPAWLEQVHGIEVVDAGVTGEPPPTADASVSHQPGVICAVLTADCLPVLWCDRAGSRVAATHAGWRGLAAGVLEATLRSLTADGLPASELLAWIGPCIGAGAYEVGPEVREGLLARDQDFTRCFAPGRDASATDCRGSPGS